MANVTDPLVNQISGSDPQNLMEYITRQKIYDSRFWKEECFGLTVSDVLEKAVALQCIGVLPSHSLALTLKLLQLHPEPSLIRKAFVEQTDFKYVRTLGCLYMRLMATPTEIYETLEPLYADDRTIRVWAAPYWDRLTVDVFVHQLLTPGMSNCVGIALPRLPSRRILQEAGHLPEGPRETAIQDALDEHSEGGKNPLLSYLRHLALIDKIPSAIVAWEKRESTMPESERRIYAYDKQEADEDKSELSEKPKKKKRRKEKGYGSLFKKSKASTSAMATKFSKYTMATDKQPLAAEGSDEYWNEERAKLGLSKLK